MMKWWGWGDPEIAFPIHKKPHLWPWIKKTLGVQVERKTPPVSLESIRLPEPVMNELFLEKLRRRLKPDQMLVDHEERVLHAYGKSYPDLFKVRHGDIHRAPDLIVLPESHDQVEFLVQEAHLHNVVIIPFGGGTNIVGCVDPVDQSGRMIVSLDMRRMTRLLKVDPYSNTAVIEAGAKGPKLEKDLQEKGFSLGHYPDSFEYSTLGGWLATRSAGMQSDAYGRIEDMLVSLRLVAPLGTLTTMTTPATSAGPDLNRLMLGSEGTMGVITEATMRVHPTPALKDYHVLLFKSFEEGFEAIHDCIVEEIRPSMLRLSDEGETELFFQLKTPKPWWKQALELPVKWYLKSKGFQRPVLMIVGFEGKADDVEFRRRRAFEIFKTYRAFHLPRKVAETWYADKFNVPYLRDFIMDYGCMVDVSETATVWSQVLPLYNSVMEALQQKFAQEGHPGYSGCHISHTYETGACLYFTYSAQQRAGQEIVQYYEYKTLVTDTITKNGGTLSHHHAVGFDHLPWLTREVTPTGMEVIRAVKETMDPKGIMNPGKLIPSREKSMSKNRAVHSQTPFLEQPL